MRDNMRNTLKKKLVLMEPSLQLMGSSDRIQSYSEGTVFHTTRCGFIADRLTLCVSFYKPDLEKKLHSSSQLLITICPVLLTK